ncbi:E3 ubiquitin ligase Rnf157 [Drosophila grimshawi]|uniref:RING-type E3 ubiquitin transferase n=1 Tax=Drosophila grimshawi TaxID=7222 RepID=B4JL40_DROGR|nr:E3 ubiquitin ligase Rnf157 [Drosophila grimshawi]EDW00293.1 GH11938 [Drosophila grimshawi]
MGNFVSRQNADVEEADHIINNAYKYPPRMGSFFGTHFIMGGERFDTPQPESYLFGENVDLNFLGTRPTAFPYPPPQANEPTKTLKSLVNIRKESVRFVRIPFEKMAAYADVELLKENRKKKAKEISSASIEQVDGNVLCNMVSLDDDSESALPNYCYNVEFIFDSDAKCSITIYYFCAEDVSPSGVTMTPREGYSITSDTYHYEKGINQFFSQPSHVFNPMMIPEDDLLYSSGREQFPVAIHCVVDEGNDECRQSHTTICVIDHHPETNSYVLRALKQKIYVDGLCYLLQEIYGIENKAVNKTSLDEDIDDHGSECVICMSETRDTLILPCRHLCLCNSCADSLRYQANNCPICRAPFRALLQIRAVQKGISTHVLHQNTPTSAAGEHTPLDVPPGYIPVSLIEALNGPPQYVARARSSENDAPESATVAASTMTTEDIKTTSPIKSSSQRRPKIKKNASTCTTTNEVGTLTNQTGAGSTQSVVEIENDPKKTPSTCTSPKSPSTPTPTLSCSPEKQEMHIVNERHNGLKYQKRSTGNHDDDEDSENEKLSPLLSPGSRVKHTSTKSLKQVVESLSGSGDEDNMVTNRDDIDAAVSGSIGSGDVNQQEDKSSRKSSSLKRSSHRPELSDAGSPANEPGLLAANLSAEDSDYYTPEDTQNTILSPLCPAERAKSGDPLCGTCGVASHANSEMSMLSAAGVSYSTAMKKNQNLQKKSTSVGNIVGPSGAAPVCSGVVELKSNNVSSLPDMLDSPVSGNSASTRSSSDSYSSSSSTKQLLSSNTTTAAANIIVDDKTALQNAVNV